MIVSQKHSFIFLISAVFLLQSCVKDECKPSSYMEYRWEIPVSLSPAKDTFNIGDTILVTSIFSDQVREKFYGKKYKLENYKFYPVTSLRRLDSIQNPHAAVYSDFTGVEVTTLGYNYHEDTGFPGGFQYVGEYSYLNGKYSLEFKLILKHSGFYLFNQESYLSGNSDVNWNVQEFGGKCRKWTVSGAINLNDNSTNNIEMLNSIIGNDYIDWVLRDPAGGFYEKGGYCFYVKE